MDRTLSNVQKLKISKKYSTYDSPITSSSPVSLIEIPLKRGEENDFEKLKTDLSEMKVTPDENSSIHNQNDFDSSATATSENKLFSSNSQKFR